MKTTTTHLTGKNFQKAHLALCARRKMGAVAHRYDKKAIVDSVLIAIGMLLGALLLGTALGCCIPEGNGWHVGNYASAPAWNDNL